MNRTIVNSESKNRSSIELRDDNKHIIILILLRRKDSNLQPSDSKSDATANCATAQFVSNASTLDTYDEGCHSFITSTMISHECNDVKSIMIKAIILANLCFMIIHHIMFIGRGEGSRTLLKQFCRPLPSRRAPPR